MLHVGFLEFLVFMYGFHREICVLIMAICVGNFNVAEHIEAEENNGKKLSNHVLVAFGLILIGHGMWLII